MSFQDFASTDDVIKKYDLIRRDEEFVDYHQIQPISPSEILAGSLKFDLQHHPQILELLRQKRRISCQVGDNALRQW